MRNQFLLFVMLCAAMLVGAQQVPSQVAGVFSVSDSTLVEFASSNLQFQPSTGTYRLAAQPYDIVGEANLSFDDTTYTGWIDLLCWETYTYDDWRMPASDEWMYLIHHRPNAHNLVGLATVGTQQGIIFLPDAWQQPEGLSFVSCEAAGLKLSTSTVLYADMNCTDHYTDNPYTINEWQLLADAGATFLPATGERDGHNVCCIGQAASYWSATSAYPDEAYRMSTIEWYVMAANNALFNQGMAVRLVRDADMPSGLEEVDDAPCTMHNGKRIENGHLVILRNGHRYSVLGHSLDLR